MWPWFTAALALLLLIAGWMLSTQRGLDFTLQRVIPLLPGTLTVAHTEGSLAGEISLRGVRFRNQSIDVEIAALKTRLQLLALLRGVVALEGLGIDGAKVALGRAESGDNSAVARQPGLPSLPELPVALRIEGLRIDQLQFDGSDGRAFEIRQVTSGQFVLEESRLVVDGFELLSDLHALSGALSYSSGDEPLLIANIKSNHQLNEKTLIIDLNADGDGRDFRLKAILDGAVAGHISATANDLGSDPVWEVNTQLAAEDLSGLNAGWPAVPLRLDATTMGQGSDLSGTGRVHYDNYPAADFSVAGDGLPGRPRLREFKVFEKNSQSELAFTGSLQPTATYPIVDGEFRWSALSGPLAPGSSEPQFSIPPGAVGIVGRAGEYRISGSASPQFQGNSEAVSVDGSLNFTGALPKFDIEGSWEKIDLKLAGEQWRVRAGHYLASGDPEGYQFSTEFSASRPSGKILNFKIAGHGDQDYIELRQANLQANAGQLSGAGRLSLRDPGVFELQLQASHMNPGFFDPAWPGDLSGRATISAKLAGDALLVNVQGASLNGSLRKQALSAEIAGRVSGGRVKSGKVSGKWGKATLLAEAGEGTDAGHPDFNWRLEVPELEQLSARGSGALTSTGQLRGKLSDPVVSLQLDATALRYQDFAVQSLSARLDTGDANLLRVSASGLSADTRRLETLELDVSGELERHAGTLRIASDDASASARFEGGWIDAAWMGQIAEGQVSIAGEPWLQSSPASLTADPQSLVVEDFCLQRDASELCMQAAWPAVDRPVVALQLKALPVAELGQLLPGGLEFAGSLSGELRVRQLGPSAVAEARFDAPTIQILRPDGEQDLALLDLEQMSGSAQIENGQMQLTLSGTTGARAPLNARLEIPFKDWSVAQGPVSGVVRGEFDRLGLLSLAFPDVSGLRGQVLIDLNLSGSTSEPALAGEVRLNDAEAQIPALGLRLTAINARATGMGDQIEIQLTARSGEGALELGGNARRTGGTWQGGMKLQGEQFLASALPEATVVLSPDLNLEFSGKDLQLRGEVTVDEAQLAPRDLRTAVQSSPDTVLVGSAPDQRQNEGVRLSSEVSITLSDSVHFSGFGLDARIAGSLKVLDESQAVTTAVGELDIVDGTYRIYGRDLDIRRGRLLFSGGPLANPGLDIMATRTLEGEIEAGVVVRANLREPRVTLYSQPSMAPSQTLSYLLIGQPLADIGDGDRQLVNDAASKLAGAGGGLLAQQLGRRLGLDDVSIASAGTGDQASLVIGTYLSPRLYASYGVGLFENLNTLRLRYLLSSRWTLRAESGLNQSVDLEYSLSR